MAHVLYIEHRNGTVTQVADASLDALRKCALGIVDEARRKGGVSMFVDGDVHFKAPFRLSRLHVGMSGPLFSGRPVVA